MIYNRNKHKIKCWIKVHRKQNRRSSTGCPFGCPWPGCWSAESSWRLSTGWRGHEETEFLIWNWSMILVTSFQQFLFLLVTRDIKKSTHNVYLCCQVSCKVSSGQRICFEELLKVLRPLLIIRGWDCGFAKINMKRRTLSNLRINESFW